MIFVLNVYAILVTFYLVFHPPSLSILFSNFSGPNPTPNTRKFFKKQCDDLGRYQMPEEEILKKRAKLDESFIAATNPELSSGKKSRRSSVSTPNLPNRNVATPVREKWKDDLEAKGKQVYT